MSSAGFSVRVDSEARGRPDLVALALLAFALSLLVFLLLPPLLKGDVGVIHGFTGQELMDLFTPIVAMPLLVLAFELTGRVGLRARLVVVVLISIWVAGQGMHLATNALGDLFKAGPERDAFYATSVGNLDHWFDEVLSHWLWHVAWLGMLGVLLWIGAAGRAMAGRALRIPAVVAGIAGLVHGFTWFVVTDEGGTWPLALPATAVLLVLGWLARRRDVDRVISTFIVVGAAVSLVLYAIWIALYGWDGGPASPCEKIGC